MLQFFAGVCWHQMIEHSLKQCFLIYLRPPSSIPKSKVENSPLHEIGLVSVYAGFLTNLSDAVRHVSYIIAFKTHFQENACFYNYVFTKHLSEEI